jgi:hypothetical protein
MDITTELQAKARRAITLRNEAEVMVHKATLARLAADTAAAEYNLAIAEDAARHQAPPGFQRDVFGDGTFKPAKDCKPLPPAKEEP